MTTSLCADSFATFKCVKKCLICLKYKQHPRCSFMKMDIKLILCLLCKHETQVRVLSIHSDTKYRGGTHHGRRWESRVETGRSLKLMVSQPSLFSEFQILVREIKIHNTYIHTYIHIYEGRQLLRLNPGMSKKDDTL